MSINERFKDVISLLNVKDSEVAQACDVSLRTISRLKNSTVTAIPVPVLYNLYTTYGVNLNWLICGIGEKLNTNNATSGVEKANESRVSYHRRKLDDTKYSEHLEDENKWLREKYDTILKLLEDKRGFEGQHKRTSG